MTNDWVDFAEIRKKVSLEQILLGFYKLDNLKRQGQKLIGPCPVHGGDSPRAFHADLDKNVWHCFSGCRRGGNQLDLVALKENIPIREAALKLQAFCQGKATPLAPPSPRPEEKPKEEKREKIADRKTEESNRPINIQLDLKHDHPHLIQDRKLEVETAELFGVGYCSRGIMRGCIAIPIHDDQGRLVAYAGRRLKPSEVREFGKYKFPKGFRKELVLYNLHRAKKQMAESGLILVEGFFSTLKLHEAGLTNVVAAMGCSLSEKQAELLQGAKEVTVLFDGDDAGVAGAMDVRERLGSQMPVRLVRLPAGTEPEDLSPQAMRWLVFGLKNLDLSELTLTREGRKPQS